jgi:D-sedoheptulose 7-phosphate isomerase
MFESTLAAELHAHTQLLELTVQQASPEIEAIINGICQCMRQGHKLLLCGNGGSAADAQHVAAEFINRFRFDRAALPAMALTTDSSILSCIGNDSEFANVFLRQVEALGQPGDICVGISTSGRSANVLKALEAARRRSVITIGFTGAGGQALMAPLCDYCLIVPSTDTARIQECHEFVWHVICGAVEQNLFPQP